MFKLNRNPNPQTTQEWVAGSPGVVGYQDAMRGLLPDRSMIGNAQYRQAYEEGLADTAEIEAEYEE